MIRLPLEHLYEANGHPLMQKIIITLLSILCLSLSSCSLLTPYQPDVQQGNIVTPAMVSSLKPGMSKDEVLSIMGQSVLENVFTNNHWAYVYTFQHSGGKILKKRLDLYFQNNRLVHMTGDFGSF